MNWYSSSTIPNIRYSELFTHKGRKNNQIMKSVNVQKIDNGFIVTVYDIYDNDGAEIVSRNHYPTREAVDAELNSVFAE